MSRRRKLEKFGDLLNFPNVFETNGLENTKLKKSPFETVSLKGQWKAKVFSNDNPIFLELACGRGEYALQLARMYPDRNYIGIDIKGARIWQGARIALQENLKNIVFLRIRIERVASFFDAEEVQGIWITFPDPFPNKVNRRLTSPNFLSAYNTILHKIGRIHLKTDDPDLYTYTLDTVISSPAYRLLYDSDDIYSKPLFSPELAFKTHYELIHLENKKTIKYLVFELNE